MGFFIERKKKGLSKQPETENYFIPWQLSWRGKHHLGQPDVRRSAGQRGQKAGSPHCWASNHVQPWASHFSLRIVPKLNQGGQQAVIKGFLMVLTPCGYVNASPPESHLLSGFSEFQFIQCERSYLGKTELSRNLRPHVRRSQKKKNHTEFSIKREEIMTEEISSLSMSISSHEEKWQCGLYITYSFLFPV